MNSRQRRTKLKKEMNAHKKTLDYNKQGQFSYVMEYKKHVNYIKQLEKKRKDLSHNKPHTINFWLNFSLVKDEFDILNRNLLAPIFAIFQNAAARSNPLRFYYSHYQTTKNDKDITQCIIRLELKNCNKSALSKADFALAINLFDILNSLNYTVKHLCTTVPNNPPRYDVTLLSGRPSVATFNQENIEFISTYKDFEKFYPAIRTRFVISEDLKKRATAPIDALQRLIAEMLGKPVELKTVSLAKATTLHFYSCYVVVFSTGEKNRLSMIEIPVEAFDENGLSLTAEEVNYLLSPNSTNLIDYVYRNAQLLAGQDSFYKLYEAEENV